MLDVIVKLFEADVSEARNRYEQAHQTTRGKPNHSVQRIVLKASDDVLLKDKEPH